MTNLLSFVENILPVLIAIFIVVLCTIIVTRAVLMIMLHFAKKHYHQIKEKIKNKRLKFEPKADEELMKVKEDELSISRPVVERMPATIEQEQERSELSQTTIVDIVKPVGFFTSMILGQKLTYLVSSAKLMNQNSHKGFWVSMVEAQERAQGRERGRSL